MRITGIRGDRRVRSRLAAVHTMKRQLLEAARATAIPAGRSGRWRVIKCTLRKKTLANRYGKLVALEPGVYTKLCYQTDVMAPGVPYGDVVMEDTPFELRTHLDFMLRAHGKVFVAGLGLGCVVRGLLANPAVKQVTVLELSQDVLDLVQPHMPADRLEIIQADAIEWAKRTWRRFDCAWHDLYSDESAVEESLHVKHCHLLAAMMQKAPMQGAWNLPRYVRRELRASLEMNLL